MRNIKLVIEYDGKDFNGWQKQPNKLNIQGEIEKVIYSITGEEVNLIASGRTDAGVHAIGQVANFKTNSNIPIDKFGLAINTCSSQSSPRREYRPALRSQPPAHGTLRLRLYAEPRASLTSGLTSQMSRW